MRSKTITAYSTAQFGYNLPVNLELTHNLHCLLEKGLLGFDIGLSKGAQSETAVLLCVSPPSPRPDTHDRSCNTAFAGDSENPLRLFGRTWDLPFPPGHAP